MLLLILIVIIGTILWKTGNAKMKKTLVFTVMGLSFIALMHTALQFNISQKSSVTVQSEGVTEGDINNHKHEKQQQQNVP